MEKMVLWDNDIEKAFLKASENQLDDFLELIRFIHKNHIPDAVCEDTLDQSEIWDWLYSKDQIELNDIKKELIIYVERAKCLSKDEFDGFLRKIGKLFSTKVLLLLFDEKDIYHISTILEYYAGIRSYLKMEKKDDFCKDLQECFPNIHFSEGIGRSVNTLNQKFEEIREEIVDHLIRMNDYQVRFAGLLKEHKSYREIAQIFSADTGIDCSPQAGREKV